jgi:hypothetical protein
MVVMEVVVVEEATKKLLVEAEVVLVPVVTEQ